ncbi:radical SAM protein [Streptomyces roseolus]|uniref:radical SAM protein n=1 Tax=Streptomyces roseolus TaxID=67358 RepID=UPI0037B15FA2
MRESDCDPCGDHGDRAGPEGLQGRTPARCRRRPRLRPAELHPVRRRRLLPRRATDALPRDTDLVLLGIKSWDPETYRKLTGPPLKPPLDFARRLAELGQDTHVRFVLVPGLTDDPADAEGVAAFAGGLGNVSRVDVLPFRKLGEAKWQALGMPFTLHGTPSPAPEQVAAVREVFRSHGLHAV